jgi:3',5'-cyclic AMP phosphodiesterase CpdA
MVRVIQISDTHLSRMKPHFADNWSPIADWLKRQQPDLVVHTGDVTVDGADQEDDMQHCAELMRSLGLPVLAVPGNHDVGDAGDRHQPVDDVRLARWRRHLGPDRWVHDLEGWRLIGLNALLLGSDTAEETKQMEWLAAAMADAGGRKLGWFLHRPVFLDSPDEGDTGYWSVKPAPRKRLLDLLRRHDVALVASGHLHRAHDRLHDGTRYVWGPSSGFLVGPDMHPPMDGAAELGAVIYEFEGRDVSVNIARLRDLKPYWIDDVIHEVYPPRSAA